jgi:hypothetical protein
MKVDACEKSAGSFSQRFGKVHMILAYPACTYIIDLQRYTKKKD